MRHHEICRDQFGGKENIQVREDDKLFFWGRSFLRNKLLVTKGIDTRSKDATNVAPGLTTRSKKLQGARSFLGNRFTGNQGLFVSLLGLSPVDQRGRRTASRPRGDGETLATAAILPEVAWHKSTPI